jgi:hypothetical protein
LRHPPAIGPLQNRSESRNCRARLSLARGLIIRLKALTWLILKKPQNGGGEMKLVMAIVKPFKLDEVRQALTELGLRGHDRD